MIWFGLAVVEEEEEGEENQLDWLPFVEKVQTRSDIEGNNYNILDTHTRLYLDLEV